MYNFTRVSNLLEMFKNDLYLFPVPTHTPDLLHILILISKMFARNNASLTCQFCNYVFIVNYTNIYYVDVLFLVSMVNIFVIIELYNVDIYLSNLLLKFF